MAKELEEKFLSLWKEMFPTLELKREMKLIKERKFLFDFVEEESKTVIEINGGNWVRGRHSHPMGLDKDYEKIILAAMEGYQVLCLSGKQITKPYLNKVQYIMERRGSNLP